MPKGVAVIPARCTGCGTCALTCSVVNCGEFGPARGHISVARREFAGTFEISFSSTCKSCGACALACPSGALQVVELVEAAGERGRA